MKVMSSDLVKLYQSDCDMLSKRGIVMNSGDRFTTGDWFISPVLYAIERRVSEVYGKWLYESKIECIYTFADGDGGWAEARAATRIEAAMKFAEILPTQSGSERTQDEYEGKVKDVHDIVKQYLIDNGYDGLLSEDGECACEVSDLVPCCSDFTHCEAGHKALFLGQPLEKIEEFEAEHPCALGYGEDESCDWRMLPGRRTETDDE